MWPTPQDYNEAVQNPGLAFSDRVLRDCTPTLNSLGLPKPVSGSFASVYQMIAKDGSQWAVRCFLHNVPDQAERYKHISDALKLSAMPYTVPFEFIANGIRIGSNSFPIVKMEWVEGASFTNWLQKNHDNSAALLTMEREFTAMCNTLRKSGIAHGDLQHGNILIADNRIRLVDYDGLYVDALMSLGSNELGHRHYQHPQRQKDHFGPYLDNFSSWSIYTSLHCLAQDVRLWKQLGGGEECLLFRQEDYVNPNNSVAFGFLEQHDSEVVRQASKTLRRLLLLDPQDVPPLGEPVDTTVKVDSLPPFSIGGVGLEDHASIHSSAPPNASLRELREQLVITVTKPRIKLVADEDEKPGERWYESNPSGALQHPAPAAPSRAATRPPAQYSGSTGSTGYSSSTSRGTGSALIVLAFSAMLLVGMAGMMRSKPWQNLGAPGDPVSTIATATQSTTTKPVANYKSLRVVTELKPLSMNLPNPTESEIQGMSEFDKGISEYEQARYSSAITAFERARTAMWQIDFDKNICDYQIARCDYKLGNVAEAVTLFNRVQQQADKYKFAIPSLALDLGYSYLKQKNYESAAMTFVADRDFRVANDLDIHGPTIGLHQVALEQLADDEPGAIKTYIAFMEGLKKPEELQHWYTGPSSIETMVTRDAARARDPKVREALEKQANRLIKEFI